MTEPLIESDQPENLDQPTNSIATSTLHTPDGPFSIIVDNDAVLAAGWTADTQLLASLIHPTLRPSNAALLGPNNQDGPGSGDPATAKRLHQATGAVAAFYDGDPSFAYAMPVKQKSGPFREAAWEQLRKVNPGESISYTQLATRTGNPAAVRAAASACATNAAALFVPCHRVLRSDGSLGGFRYGLGIKRSLLAREAAETA